MSRPRRATCAALLLVLLPLLAPAAEGARVRVKTGSLTYYGDDVPEEVLAVFAVVFGIFGLVLLAAAVVMVVSMWRLFERAGQPGWAALVPIYNMVVLLRVAGRPEWWVILMLVPMVNLGVAILLSIDLARVFGREEVFAVGLVLMPFVFYPILAFGRGEYIGPEGGGIDGRTTGAGHGAGPRAQSSNGKREERTRGER